MSKVVPIRQPELTKEATLTDAYLCSIELIRLQQVFFSLKTIEEKLNNVARTQQCLEIIHNFVTREFLKTLDS